MSNPFFIIYRMFVNSIEFLEYVRDILQPEGVALRAMFGGHGVYKGKVMIGIVADNELYLKADREAALYFEGRGSVAFTYKRKDKMVALSYWKVLPEVAEDPEGLRKWIDLAISSAISGNNKK